MEKGLNATRAHLKKKKRALFPLVTLPPSKEWHIDNAQMQKPAEEKTNRAPERCRCTW